MGLTARGNDTWKCISPNGKPSFVEPQIQSASKTSGNPTNTHAIEQNPTMNVEKCDIFPASVVWAKNEQNDGFLRIFEPQNPT